MRRRRRFRWVYHNYGVFELHCPIDFSNVDYKTKQKITHSSQCQKKILYLIMN